LDNEGPVRLLRLRLVRHFTGTSMASKQDPGTERASPRRDLSLEATHSGPQERSGCSQVGDCANVFPVIIELLRKVPAFSSEEFEVNIFRLFKSRRMNFVSQVERTGERRRSYRLLVGKTEENNHWKSRE